MRTDRKVRDPIDAIGVLSEPKRRELYDLVATRGEPVARDEAAAAVRIGVPLAAFHLDRLVDAGLLQVEYKRRGDRRGPGAGRPAKHYRRADATIEVSLPVRRYEVASALLADAIAALGPGALDALRESARARGRAIASVALHAAGADGTGPGMSGRVTGADAPGQVPGTAATDGPRDAVIEVLAASGFEPAEDRALGLIRLRNCPFDGLVRENEGVACPMNVALIEGVAEEVGGVVAVPEETPGYCCVALRRVGQGT